MLSPEYMRACADEMVMLAEHIDAYCIQKIAERMTIRLEKGKKMLSATDKYQIRAMQETGALLADISKELSKASGLAEEIVNNAIKEASITALDAEDAVYGSMGMETGKPSTWFKRLAERNARKVRNTIRNLTGTFGKSVGDVFNKMLNEAMALITSGAVSAGQAIIDAIRRMSQHGIQVTYGENDRPESLEVATARAIRTGIAQTNGDIAIKRMEEMDWDIILVSAHLGARNKGDGFENHEKWQGKFYSRTGQDKRFPEFYSNTGYGTLLGLCGVNCRHSFGAGDGEHNPYTRPTEEENGKQVDIDKKARAMERRIRAIKKQLEALRASRKVATDEQVQKDLDEEIKTTRARLRKANEAYREFCDENGLKPREERLAI